MYLVESILNVFFRSRMRTFLHSEEMRASVTPPASTSADAASFLYVHIPFCESLCPYCSFHRCEYEFGLAKRYFEALWQELELYKNLGYDFRGVYIGGGTPTIMMDGLIETLDRLRTNFNVEEVSIETNPNHLTEDNLTRLQQAKVNRLSVGVQSFDDDVLKHIGRYHKYGSGEEILKRLETAVGRFDTLNVDLIFNIPCQSPASLERDLDIIDALLPEQVTLYPLMTAPSVEQALKERVGQISYQREKEYYFTILRRLTKHFQASTAWCFSRKATMIDEYIINYENYVGAGSGAFGYLNDSLLVNTFDLEDYIRRLARKEFPVTRVRQFKPKEKMYYYLLRKLFALSVSQTDIQEAWGNEFKKQMSWELFWLKSTRAVRDDGNHLTATDRGKYYLVMAMREFFIAVDTMRDQCRRPLNKERSAQPKEIQPV